MIAEATAESEAAIWRRMIELNPADLTPDAARYIMALGFSSADQERIRQLAERNQDGLLSDTERRELENFIHVDDLLALLQSKARGALRETSSAA